ncbi:hypothetical protein ACIQAC_32965 [Streptomyces sp. NPDC088387]|uniref:hypothetical protein n=1 Tax=Streptomyces sp. NPDC088387 TaxID=3365859 RepID=UPI0038088089
MGDWAVIVQYGAGETYKTEFVGSGWGTKEQALEELRAAAHTYVPSRSLIEKRRRVYRLSDQESYLVVIRGKMTEWECTLRIAELVSDTADPEVAGRAQWTDGAGVVAEGPQDRVPPGY